MNRGGHSTQCAPPAGVPNLGWEAASKSEFAKNQRQTKDFRLAFGAAGQLLVRWRNRKNTVSYAVTVVPAQLAKISVSAGNA